MATVGTSPKNNQRLCVFDAYRGRGRRNNDLFLVYSVKTDRDWILSSDRQLVHWVHYLETAPEVQSFDLAAPQTLPKVAKTVSHKDFFNARVLLRDGETELHTIQSGKIDKLLADTQISAESAATSKPIEKTRVFTDTELEPFVRSSVRWLKPIAYAATIRGQEYPRALHMLVDILETHAIGQIRHIFSELNTNEHDAAVVLGLLVRLAIQGLIRLDLDTYGFSYATRWEWVRKS